MATSKPPKSAAGSIGGAEIDPGTVQLLHIHFERLAPSTENEASEQADDAVFELRVVRVDETAVAVGLGVKVTAPGVAEIEVRAQTKLTVEFADSKRPDREEELAKIVGQLGPVIVYPYLREMVADVTRRAGLNPLTLPVYPIGTFFTVKPQELKLKKAPGKTKKK